MMEGSDHNATKQKLLTSIALSDLKHDLRRVSAILGRKASCHQTSQLNLSHRARISKRNFNTNTSDKWRNIALYADLGRAFARLSHNELDNYPSSA